MGLDIADKATGGLPFEQQDWLFYSVGVASEGQGYVIKNMGATTSLLVETDLTAFGSEKGYSVFYSITGWNE